MIVFRQSGCDPKKIGCIREKVIVFGQKWLYSGKSCCIRENWLDWGQVSVYGQNWLYSGISCCIRAKVVVLG